MIKEISEQIVTVYEVYACSFNGSRLVDARAHSLFFTDKEVADKFWKLKCGDYKIQKQLAIVLGDERIFILSKQHHTSAQPKYIDELSETDVQNMIDNKDRQRALQKLSQRELSLLGLS